MIFIKIFCSRSQIVVRSVASGYSLVVVDAHQSLNNFHYLSMSLTSSDYPTRHRFCSSRVASMMHIILLRYNIKLVLQPSELGSSRVGKLQKLTRYSCILEWINLSTILFHFTPPCLIDYSLLSD